MTHRTTPFLVLLLAALALPATAQPFDEYADGSLTEDFASRQGDSPVPHTHDFAADVTRPTAARVARWIVGNADAARAEPRATSGHRCGPDTPRRQFDVDAESGSGSARDADGPGCRREW
ncbi:MAG: hypothetical protein KIT73_09215 [Burkholderiales bacterium]|nr:hypothetical protein [Burkholderiales bacterium]